MNSLYNAHPNDKANPAGVGKPTTEGTGKNAKGDGVVTMFAGNTMGSQLHEQRHGGQIARGDFTQTTYGVQEEISAYRAEYSWNGKLEYRSSLPVSPEEALARFKSGKDPTIESINDIRKISTTVILSMVDPGYKPIYPPAGVSMYQFVFN